MMQTAMMQTAMMQTPAPPNKVRLRGAVLLLALMFMALILSRVLFAGTLIQFGTAVIAPLVTLLLMAVWVFRFSRLATFDRLAIAATVVIFLAAAALIVDRSMRPLGLIMYGIPLLLLLPVVWLAAVGRTMLGWRRMGVYVWIIAPIGLLAVLRIEGLDGRFSPSFAFRWSESAEQRYLQTLAQTETDRTEPSAPTNSTEISPIAEIGDWPGFRGPARDGVVRHEQLPESAEESALVELWRRPLGPGWSSFAVVGNRLYTQEQRGEDEAIVCLNAANGEQVWAHTYPGRFYEVVSNAGPRATPTFDSGRIYAVGARGTVIALDAASGSPRWQSDLNDDTAAKTPEWGFASSPLVVAVDSDNTIPRKLVVALAGDPGAKVIAYDAEDGSVVWKSLSGGLTYSSPQLLELDGTRQIVVTDGDGAYGLRPTDGQLLWQHDWPLMAAPRIVQPLKIDDHTLLIGTGYGEGIRRLKITQESGSWQVIEDWTSRAMKPYFNDFVLHQGFLYGFDHEIVACVDLETGERMWKRGRYGFGQMLLIPRLEALLVLGERGELALLRATPDREREVEHFKIQAFEGKTWNHPVLVGDCLYLRNSEEAVCYQFTDLRRP